MHRKPLPTFQLEYQAQIGEAQLLPAWACTKSICLTTPRSSLSPDIQCWTPLGAAGASIRANHGESCAPEHFFPFFQPQICNFKNASNCLSTRKGCNYIPQM